MNEVLADHTHAVMYRTLKASRPDGRELDASGAMAFKLDPEGKVAESWFPHRDQPGYNTFWA